ncbi:MAG TPA: hypothetical protein PKW08_00720 [Flavobacteriaceae bacterium]|nr:hypothetical protein [Flavobacteriaceae bacterium]MCB9211919.1 hypothetical protein [Alteromonas sp.]HPF09987.1 hypothetical protein [Flavobacteriaceae bacterium]HQU20084.1 hypothetical protein [Flavobacteriaceae bacterium]HQU63930.1 hypothetical protein [Flavobacteriaceae bacterium]
MSQNLNRIALVAMILSLWLESLELSFVVASIVLFLSFRPRLSRNIASIVLLMLVLILIGFLGIFSVEAGAYGFIKDLIYFLRPLTIMLATYFVVSRLEKKSDFFNIIVICGFGFAVWHLLHIGTGLLTMRPNLDKFRGVFGKLNHVELLALFSIICIKGLPIKHTRYKAIYQFLVICLGISFLLYFSRTMIVVLGIMVMAYYGYLKLNRRGAIALAFLMVLSGAFIVFIRNYEPSNTQDPGIGTMFLEKLKNSYTEAFEPVEFDRFKMDRRELWPRWRAYEANLVLTENDKEKLWFTGQGFGSTVDVGFEIILDGAYIQHLPTTHNGLAYVYLKTGILGLLVYFSIIGLLYLYYYKKDATDHPVSYHRVLAACAFYMLASSMVVTGIFKQYEMISFLLGGTFALKQFDR